MKPDLEISAWEARPVPLLPEHEDAVLGKLVLERDGWLRAERTLGGVRYEVAIAVRDFGDAKATDRDVKKGRAAILRAERLLPEILDRVTAKMHPLYGRVWRGERYAYIAADFREMLKLSSISSQGDRTTVWFGIGSLFEDHGIEVRLARGRISDIGLA